MLNNQVSYFNVKLVCASVAIAWHKPYIVPLGVSFMFDQELSSVECVGKYN